MTHQLKVLIVDDEPPARSSLRSLLGRHTDIEIVGECEDGLSAVRAIRETRPDLVFLDVQIPGADGFEVLRRLGSKRSSAIVFVTAFDEYALRAFEAHAIDYLLKPFSDERFADVLRHARQTVRRHRLDSVAGKYAAMLEEASSGTIASRGQLVIREGNTTVVIPWGDIEWIEAEDYYTRIHAGRRRPLVRRTLRSLVETLDSGRFIRVHRSAIVNLEHVREVRPMPGGEQQVHMASGAIVRVSRGCKDELARKISRVQ